MAMRFLSRTRSFRSPAGADTFGDEGGVSSPVLVGTNAQPRDDLYILQPNTTSPQRHSPSRPRTATSPERHQSKMNWNAPTQNHYHSNWGFEFPPPPNSHAIDSPTRAEDLNIGMALGSPSQVPQNRVQSPLPPLPAEAEDNNPTSVISSSPSPFVSDYATPKTSDLSKQKTKWKKFGGLFGKKTTSSPMSPTSPLYRPQPTSLEGSKSDSRPSYSHKSTDRELEKTKDVTSLNKTLGKGTDSTKNKYFQKHRPQNLNIQPNLSRANTAPILQTDERSPTPPPKDLTGQNGSSFSRVDGGPMMLQVEIPNVAMDRYSVMFGSVLKPRQPSLLIRRQAQLENLKTTGDEEPLSESRHDGELLKRRRATSPSPHSKSPSFSLFPSTPNSRNRTPSPQPLYRPSQLQRSATVPLTSSPMRSTFEVSHSTIKDPSAIIVMVHSPAHPPDTPVSSRKAKWSSDLSPTSTEATLPEEQISDQVRRDEALHGLKLSAPSFIQTENTRPTFKLSSPPVKKRQAPQRNSPIEALESPADSQNPPKDTPDSCLPANPSSNISNEKIAFSQNSASIAGKGKAAKLQHFSNIITTNPLTSSPPSVAEISIARQISVSRRQRQMVVPIVPKTARQPMQATLVNIVGGDDKVEGETKGHDNRKSHHVLLEDA